LRELSLHIMDIIENGINAGADLITLSVVEDGKENRLRITITDNGRGIPPELLDRVMDPFFTTRTTRRIGLGLSLFREASRRCEGEFDIRSKEGEGSEVRASFRLDHIDLAPVGGMDGALTSLIMGSPGVDFVYTHDVDGREFRLDTREIREQLGDVPIQHPRVLKSISAMIRESLAELRGGRP
jgi:anti-sigma regulatory factor (Ser/Thr protein kinase)